MKNTEAAAWPRYAAPEDVDAIEATPLEDRDLPATTYQALQRAAAAWPERIALTAMPDAGRWGEAADRTYARFAADVAAFAQALARRGVGATTPVGILAPNCLQLVPATLAAETAGVAVPLNGGLGIEHLTALLERAGVRHLIAAGPDLDPNAWEKAAVLAAGGRIDHLYLVEPTGAGTRTPVEPPAGVAVDYLVDAAADEDGVFDDPHTADDIAAVFHTGGTTGVPKLAAHTHRNQIADAWMIAADSTVDAAADEQAAVFAALPLFHVNALHVTVLAPLMKGQRVVWGGPLGFRDPLLYGEIWRIVEHFRIRTLSAVPTVYAVLAGCPVDADISSLRFAVAGAAALTTAVRDAFETHTGVPLLEGYGLTEGTCASARSFITAPRPGSVGKRMPYQPMRVVTAAEDGTWTDVPTGNVGTLLIAGPTVFAGYVTGFGADGFVLDPLGMVRDGWLDTGDLARIDTDGFVHLTGRAKDLIIRGGHNIEPAAIEAALLDHPAVADAAAVGKPDARAGEVPVAYVTLHAGMSATAAELERSAAVSGLEPAARPKTVTVLDALPLTDIGKPNKLALRADASAAAVREALSDRPGIAQVSGAVVDGSVLVTVTSTGADDASVLPILDQFSVTSEVVPS